MRCATAYGTLSAVLLLLLLIPLSAQTTVEVDEEEIIFRLSHPGGKKVFLVGDFNGWNPTMDRMAERDGGYELRLFLLPGRYRYLFIVEGVSRPDPDNQYRDEDGNSFFIIRERDGRYEIVFEETFEAAGGIESVDAAFAGEGVVTAGEGGGVAFFKGSAGLVIDEHVEVDLSAALEYAVTDGEEPRGRSYILNGSAGYRLDNGIVTAFTRADLVDLGDPLETFGDVGPYDYPLGLFCRGLRYEGDIARFVQSRVVYASRIDGYRTGLESSPSAGDLFASRDLTDSDMIGVAIGRRIGRVELYYLYRRDHRPKGDTWRPPGSDDTVYRGYEKTRMTGVWTVISGPEGFTLEAEYLHGKSILASRERMAEGAPAFEPFDLDLRWEEGSRFLVGFTFHREWLDARAVLHGTTIEGLSALRGGRPDGACTVLKGDVGVRIDELTCRAGASAEAYSAGNTGDVFWLQRYNFWLDGDRLEIDRLPLLASNSVHVLHLHLGWRDGGDARDPYGTGLRIDMMRRMDGNDPHHHVTELVFREGLPVRPGLTHILDIRYISYGHAAWKGERHFVDFFTALQLRISPTVWVSVGAGVNPYRFDRWRYRFDNYGREEYLIDRGILASVGENEETGVLRALEQAESALSEEWSFVVEASVRF